ncbi:MAG: rhodanese-like domain-containing protein [Planctomycetota bacterium]|jgi:rhodanese-related sulfurtransferase
MMLVDAQKAVAYFEDKLDFTTGPMELNAMIERNDNIMIIDVRGPDDYGKGHIPGAVNLPKDSWDTFSGLDKDRVNIVYCYSEVCHLAAGAAKRFAEAGFSVMELEGGFDTWKAFNLPVEA